MKADIAADPMQTRLTGVITPPQTKGGDFMAIYHCSIKIISRSGGRSAVACAAYRAGEKLYDKETGTLQDYTSKGGVILSEIKLPEDAPEY